MIFLVPAQYVNLHRKIEDKKRKETPLVCCKYSFIFLGYLWILLGYRSGHSRCYITSTQWRTQEFCAGGVQQIQLSTEDRQNGDLRAVAL